LNCGSAGVSPAVFGLWPKTFALGVQTHRMVTPIGAVRLAGETPARATETVALPQFNCMDMAENQALPYYGDGLTRIIVLTARLPAAMDANSPGRSSSNASPSTKSEARTTPVSINSNARRIVRGV